MSKKRKAIAIGCACSLIAVGIWILLSVVFNLLAGMAGALMGILFLLPYQKLNPEDKSKFPYIVGAVVIVVEICLSEFVSLAIVANANSLPIALAFSDAAVVQAFFTDIVIGLALSAAVFGFCIFGTERRQKRAEAARRNTAFSQSADAVQNETPPTETTDSARAEAARNVTDAEDPTRRR